MKYSQEIKDFLEKQVYPILKEKSPSNLIKENENLIKKLIGFLNELSDRKKLVMWLYNQKKLYCKETNVEIKNIKADNHIKLTKTKKTITKTKITEKPSVLKIESTGDVLNVQDIKEEEEKTEEQYAKLNVVYKSEYTRIRERDILYSLKKYDAYAKSLEKQHAKIIAKANKTIEEIEKDVKDFDAVISATIKTQIRELTTLNNAVVEKIKNGQNVSKEEKKEISDLRADILNAYKNFSRAKTGALYQTANSLFPIREKMMNELKTLQEMIMKQDMSYYKLSDLDASLVAKIKVENEEIEQESSEEERKKLESYINDPEAMKKILEFSGITTKDVEEVEKS